MSHAPPPIVFSLKSLVQHCADAAEIVRKKLRTISKKAIIPKRLFEK